MYAIKISYTIELTYRTLEDAERALEILLEGGMEELTIKVIPIEEAAS